MIRVEPAATRSTSHVRFYNLSSNEKYPPFDAICTFVWDERPGHIWIEGFHGNLNRALLRELLAAFVEHGVQVVHATRAEDHILPLGRACEDGSFEIVVAELIARFAPGSRPSLAGRDHAAP